MEFFIILGFVGLLAGPVALVVAILAYRRGGRLQRELFELRSHSGEDPQTAAYVRQKTQPQPQPQPSAVAAAPVPPVTPRPATAPTGNSYAKAKPPRPRGTDFEAILGGQWLTWAGILALFFGSAFFLGVDLGASALAGLPQVLIGLALAAAFIVVGSRLENKATRFLGLGLQGGGVALLFLGMFAAYGFHHLVPLLVVLPLLLIVATVGAMLALHRNSQTIAALTLVGAILTPLVLVNLSQSDATFDALLPYLVAVNLGAVLVGLRRGWAGLPLGAFVSTLLLVTFWWEQHTHADLLAFFSVTGSWLVFGVGPWLYATKNRFWSLARAIVLAANGLFYALFCYHFLDGAGYLGQGMLLLVLAIIYFTLSAQMKARRGADAATRLSHATGAALALLAAPVLLDLAWVTIAWTALAAMLIVAGLRERDPWQRLGGLVVLAIGTFRVAFLDIPQGQLSSAGFQPLLNADFLVSLPAMALLGWTFWAYHHYEDRLHRRELRWRISLLLITVLTLLWKLSFEVVGYFSWRQQQLGQQSEPTVWLWVLLLWTVYGLAVLLIGLHRDHLPLRRSGYVMLGVALAGTIQLTLSAGLGLVQTYRPVFNLPFLQGVALAAVLGVMAWRLYRSRDGLGQREAGLPTPALLVAILLLFGKLSLEVLAFFKLGDVVGGANLVVKSQLTLSVVWGLYAGAVIAIGFARQFKPVRQLGMFLLGLTVLKVFLLDMQALDKGYRIVAFVALGVLLLIISLLYQRERQAREQTED